MTTADHTTTNQTTTIQNTTDHTTSGNTTSGNTTSGHADSHDSDSHDHTTDSRSMPSPTSGAPSFGAPSSGAPFVRDGAATSDATRTSNATSRPDTSRPDSSAAVRATATPAEPRRTAVASAVPTAAGAQAGDTHADEPRTAAFFDLDKTILARSSTLAFSRHFYAGGLINRRTVIRSAYAQFVYLLGGADHDQMERMRQELSRLVTNWSVQAVKDIVAEALHHVVDPLVYAEAVTLINEHRSAGRDVVIVSSSGQEVVEPIGAMLGADHVIATRMVVEDGRYTGEIDFYSYGENKVRAIHELLGPQRYDLARCYAYSDSITDLPLLEAVGHPYVVNPDRALRRTAAERGWPVLRFSRPVPARSRLGLNRPVLTAAALATGLAVALLWAIKRGRPNVLPLDGADLPGHPSLHT